MASRRLLVVEDVMLSLSGTIECLQQQGIVVDSASTVEQAVEKLSEQAYDAMLLDWRLPMKSGQSADDDAGGVLLSKIADGAAGPTNAAIPFTVVTQELYGVDRDVLSRYPNCLGVVEKLDLSVAGDDDRRFFT